MTIDEVKTAAAVADTLRQHEQWLRNIEPLQVEGIVLRRPGAGGEGVHLHKHLDGGGAITSLGYPDELRGVMTRALRTYLSDRVKQLRDQLIQLGVKVPTPAGTLTFPGGNCELIPGIDMGLGPTARAMPPEMIGDDS